MAVFYHGCIFVGHQFHTVSSLTYQPYPPVFGPLLADPTHNLG